MAALTAPFDVGIKPGDEIRVKMAAVKIYQGGAVGVIIGTGYATPLVVATAGMKFIGVAEETVDNSAGSAGDKWIRVKVRGIVAFDTTGTVTVAQIGVGMFFTDYDHVVQTTATAIPAGELKTVGSDGVAWVDISLATSSVLFFNPTDNKIYAQGYAIKSAALS